jgi:hypothetical protein
VEALIKLLDERIEDPETPENERTGFKKVKEGITGAGVSVAARVLGTWIERQTGLGGP